MSEFERVRDILSKRNIELKKTSDMNPHNRYLVLFNDESEMPDKYRNISDCLYKTLDDVIKDFEIGSQTI